MKSTISEALKKRKMSFVSMGIIVLSLVMIFSLSGRMLFGKSTMLFSDLYGQHIPFIKGFWRSLFRGENPFYSFSLGLGMPSLGPFVWSGALFPLNFLFLFLSEEVAAAIIILLKMALGAFMFAELLRVKWGKTDLTVVIFAICYALCGYSIVFYPNIEFADGLYMLPFIVLLGERLIKTGRWNALTIAYAYIFSLHFYEGYVVGVISFLLFLMEVLLNVREKKAKTILQYVLSVFFAVLISAAVILPMCWQILSETVADATKQSQVSLHIMDFLGNLFVGETQQFENLYPMIYSGLLSLLLVPFYFCSKDIGRKEKISSAVVFGVLLLGCFTTIGYSTWHMFDAPDGWQFRFSYGISFMLCLMGARTFPFMDKQKKIYGVIYGFLCIVILFMALKRQGESTSHTNSIFLCLLTNIIFIVLYSLFIAIKKKRYKTKVILALVIVELIINGVLCINQNVIPNYEDRQFARVYQQEVKNALSDMDLESFRVTSNGYINDSSRFGYMGFSTFSTLENGAVRDFLKKSGYAVSVRNWQDAGGTDFMKMILAGKYEIVLSVEGNVIETKENMALPLAFMASEDISQFSFSSYNAVENMNHLARALTGEEVRPLIPLEGDARMELYNAGVKPFAVSEKTEVSSKLLINPGEYEAVYRENGGMEALANYYIPVGDSRKAYAFFALDHSVNDYFDPMIISKPTEMPFSFAAAHVSRMIPLLQQNDEYMVSVYFLKESNDAVVFDKLLFAYEDEKNEKAIYENLSMWGATAFSRKGSKIEFDIEASEDMPVMFTSIPYDTGWKLYVDGSETEITSLLDEAFIGLKLEPGKHHIKMVYAPIVNRIGGLISLAGIVILTSICVIQSRNKRKKSM